MCVSKNEEAIIDQLGEDQFDCVKVLRTENRHHCSLMDRKKGTHLNPTEKAFIKELLAAHP